MKASIIAAILCVLFVALLPEASYAKPADWVLSRQKRLSDQRLAELETLIALEKLKGIAVPVGFGKVDPAIIGRRRRSISDGDLEKLQHLLLLAAQDAEDTESDQFRSSLRIKEDLQAMQGGPRFI